MTTSPTTTLDELNLSEREMAALEQLSTDHELSKTAVMRQALRLYQLVTKRLSDGERMFFTGDEQRQIEFIGLFCTPKDSET